MAIRVSRFGAEVVSGAGVQTGEHYSVTVGECGLHRAGLTQGGTGSVGNKRRGGEVGRPGDGDAGVIDSPEGDVAYKRCCGERRVRRGCGAAGRVSRTYAVCISGVL